MSLHLHYKIYSNTGNINQIKKKAIPSSNKNQYLVENNVKSNIYASNINFEQNFSQI